MAVSGEYISIPGLKASATLAAKQYYAVKLASTAHEVVVCSASDQECIGIVQNDPAAGEVAVVACLGIAKAAVEASVSAGDYLGPSATGRLKAVTADNTSIIAYAMEGATTSAADIIKVQVLGIGRY